MEIFSVLLFAASLSLPVAEVAERPDFEKTMYPGRVTPIAKVDVVYFQNRFWKDSSGNGKDGNLTAKLKPRARALQGALILV